MLIIIIIIILVVACCSSQQQGAESDVHRDVKPTPTRRRRVVTSCRYFQHGVVRCEAEFLGERTEARRVLSLLQRQRVGNSMRAGPTHTVSDPLRHHRGVPLTLPGPRLSVSFCAPPQCCIIMEEPWLTYAKLTVSLRQC